MRAMPNGRATASSSWTRSGDLPAPLQAKLLRLLHDRTFHRLGGKTPIVCQARVICSTNRDLEALVAAGGFREDLFYRINVIPVTIPPLRTRPDDILPLLRGYVRHFSETFDRPVRGLTNMAEEAALAHDWPGNVRELRNRVERAVALADQPWIGPPDLFPDLGLEEASRACLVRHACRSARGGRAPADRARAGSYRGPGGKGGGAAGRVSHHAVGEDAADRPDTRRRDLIAVQEPERRPGRLFGNPNIVSRAHPARIPRMPPDACGLAQARSFSPAWHAVRKAFLRTDQVPMREEAGRVRMPEAGRTRPATVSARAAARPPLAPLPRQWRRPDVPRRRRRSRAWTIRRTGSPMSASSRSTSPSTSPIRTRIRRAS